MLLFPMISLGRVRSALDRSGYTPNDTDPELRYLSKHRYGQMFTLWVRRFFNLSMDVFQTVDRSIFFRLIGRVLALVPMSVGGGASRADGRWWQGKNLQGSVV